MITEARAGSVLRTVLRLQGVYYLLTGIWPLASMHSFELVTGAKTDDWLVHMVGLLAAVIGVALLAGGQALRPALATLLLSAGSAAAFAGIDLRYALIGRIAPVYLLDAAVEVGILALVIAGALRLCRDDREG